MEKQLKDLAAQIKAVVKGQKKGVGGEDRHLKDRHYEITHR